MSKLNRYVKLYHGYLRINFLSLFQYKLDSIIWLISMIMREIASFLGVLIIAKFIGQISGTWGIYDCCLIFAFLSIAEATSEICCDSVWEIGHFIRNGFFDILRVRPVAVLFQLLAQRIQLQAIVSWIGGLSLLCFAFLKLNIEVSVLNILFCMETLICGSIINSCIYLIFNSLNFWIVQGEDIAILVQNIREFSKYPMQLYPKVLQLLFSFIFPFGMIGYYPVMYLTRKTQNSIPIFLISICMLLILVSTAIWEKGMTNYNSTGT